MSTISAVIVTLNLCLVALSRIMLASPRHHEEAMASWCGTSLGVSMVGLNSDGLLTVAPEASHFAAGCGARTYADGVDSGGIIINTTANIPSIEATEDAYPLIYMFRRQLVDSGGPGRFRGGVSAEVAITPYESAGPLATSFAGVGNVTPNAIGVAGGLPGATVRYLRYLGTSHLAQNGEGSSLPGSLEEIRGEFTVGEINSSKIRFDTDTIEYHNWQGGGGLGDPLDRDPQRVLADVRAGLVSRGEARRVYGVVLTGDGADSVDVAATERRRDELRRDRLRRATPYVESYPLTLPDGLAATPGAGRTRYWDIVEIDHTEDGSSCLRCGHRFGPARADFRSGCLVEELPTATAGPVRGQEYVGDARPVVLRLFYCPGCGRQLEADLVIPGQPGPSFVLVATAPGGQEPVDG